MQSKELLDQKIDLANFVSVLTHCFFFARHSFDSLEKEIVANFLPSLADQILFPGTKKSKIAYNQEML